MFKDFTLGHLGAMFGASVAVFNPLQFFPSLSVENPEETTAISDLVLFTISWMPGFETFTISWGELTQFVGLVLGVVSFIHAVHSKRKDDNE